MTRNLKSRRYDWVSTAAIFVLAAAITVPRQGCADSAAVFAEEHIRGLMGILSLSTDNPTL
jgi:hypothetical protein